MCFQVISLLNATKISYDTYIFASTCNYKPGFKMNTHIHCSSIWEPGALQPHKMPRIHLDQIVNMSLICPYYVLNMSLIRTMFLTIHFLGFQIDIPTENQIYIWNILELTT